MAQSLISLITLVSIVSAAPFAKRQEATTAPSTNTCSWTYWSVAGDDCDTISQKTQTPVDDIIAANSFLTCSDVWANTPICVPFPRPTTTIVFSPITTWYVPNCAYTYYSVEGDTCDSIGAANGQSGSAIYDANTFLDCGNIWVGTPICVPPASTTGFIPPYTAGPSTVTLTGPVTTYIDPTTTVVGLGPITTTIGLDPSPYGESPSIVTVTGPVTTYIDPTTTIVGLGPITTTIPPPGATPPPSCYTYISQAGDTCNSIAEHFGLSADAIFAANTFLDCNNIWQYTPVCIPDSQPTTTITAVVNPVCQFTYYSQQGDTCESLGAYFGVSAAKILEYNSFLNCQDVWVGTPICVPPADPITTDPITTVPVPPCQVTYTSVERDTCDSIGYKYGLPGGAISAANTFLDCNNIWPWTPVCIPELVIDYFSKRS